MFDSDKVIKEMQEKAARKQKETMNINEKILQLPQHLSEEEKKAYGKLCRHLKKA